MTSLLNSVLGLAGGSLERCNTNYLKIRFTQATTSWLEGLDGLSRFMTPELMYDFKSRLSGAQPLGIGVKCPVLTSTGDDVS